MTQDCVELYYDRKTRRAYKLPELRAWVFQTGPFFAVILILQFHQMFHASGFLTRYNHNLLTVPNDFRDFIKHRFEIHLHYTNSSNNYYRNKQAKPNAIRFSTNSVIQAIPIAP